MQQNKTELTSLLKVAASAVRGKTAYAVVDTSSLLSCDSHTDEIFRSASLIKIPVLLTYLQRVQQGKLDPTSSTKLTAEIMVPGTGVLKDRAIGSVVSLGEVAHLMIIASDNVATNILINLLGFESINQTIQILGLSSTQLRRKMQDFDAASRGFENTTCVADISKLLLRIANLRGEDSIERKAFDILLAQKLNDKLPKYLPAHIQCAHKTGDLLKLEHDAAILIDGIKNIVVVVLSDELVDNAEGVRFCQEVGRLVAENLLHNKGENHTALECRA